MVSQCGEQPDELMRAEVVKNELVDSWLRDHIKPERWDRIATVFPRAGKYSPKQQWVLMAEDANSPYRYQQYGLTVRLNPDKDDRLNSSFSDLQKTFPTLWICCAHYDCMTVYDVTNDNDTQRNIHLSEGKTSDCCTYSS